MDTDLVKLLHRIEHKLNIVLQHLLITDNLDLPARLDDPRICVGCGAEISWYPHPNGYPMSKCECETPVQAVDYTKFTPPVPKGK